MKRFVRFVVVLMASCISPILMAQTVTQAQKDGSARLVMECTLKKTPVNWELISIALDRSNSARPTLYNMVRLNGSKQFVDVDMAGCDVLKQANDLLMFQAVIPKEQIGWKVLYLNTKPTGEYAVFTDLALPNKPSVGAKQK